MLRAVLALHAHGLAHCCLQPESFRLYDGAHWKLATLDSATPFGQPTPDKVPVCYAAPELVRQRNSGATLLPVGHTRAPNATAAATAAAGAAGATGAVATAAMDVWSLGVLLWQLFSQQPLYGTEAEALAMVYAGGMAGGTTGGGLAEPSMGCITDLQARHLLPKMLQRDPSERVEPSKILKHGYLTGGLDTVQMESTFGPMQKGQLFVRSMLQEVAAGLKGKRR